MHYTGGHTDRQLQLHRVRESAQVAVRNTSDGVAESADVMTPDWKLGLEVQVWVGLGLLSLPSGCVDAIFSCVLISSYRDIGPMGSGPTLRPHLPLSPLYRPCLQIQPHSEVLG